jgi:hydrogenase expression/formation protein HypC
MCLAIPLKVLKIVDDNTLAVQSGNMELNISCMLIGKVLPGEYVLVHAGFAIQKMSEQEALETLSIVSGDSNG